MPPHSQTLILEGTRPRGGTRGGATASRASRLRRTLSARLRAARPTLLFCVAGVLLPNAMSIGAFLAGIGIPPRTWQICGYAALALIARLVHPVVTIALYLMTATYDGLHTLALLFNLAPGEFGMTLQFATNLWLFDSPFYLVMSIATAALVFANLVFLTRKRHAFRRGSAVVVTAVAAAVAVADLAANTSPHYEFGTLYAMGKPMTSAAETSGFQEAALSGSTPRVLMVMVEALGKFAHPDHQRLLLQSLQRPELLTHYELTTGSTTYYGSTTAGEIRELCHSRESYTAVLKGRDLPCLPRLMKERGYRSTALHNFTGEFFERQKWYPKLGFDKQIFGETLVRSVSRMCGSPFRGPCDVDLVPVVEQELREAKEPSFVYWLTLTTHVPVSSSESVSRLGCDRGGGPFAHSEVCIMTELWMDLMDELAKMAARLPGTEILIVGDHAPPLWSKAGRALFTPGEVPWFRLRPLPPTPVLLRPGYH